MKKAISLRETLLGAVVDLLKNEKMECIETQKGLFQIIDLLSNYSEEGRSLSPEIYIGDKFLETLKSMPSLEFVFIGEQVKEANVFKIALKKCAPLASDDWKIYISRNKKTFSFGLFRCSLDAFSTTQKVLFDPSTSESVCLLMLRQLTENVVEIKGAKGADLLVNFTSSKDEDYSPIKNIDELISKIITNINHEYTEQAKCVLQELFINVLKERHGFLVAVVSDSLPSNTLFSDSISLKPSLSLVGKIENLIKNNDVQSFQDLTAYKSLVSGMMLSDGITIFNELGNVVAFNSFISLSKSKKKINILGGARRRTYEALCNNLGKGITGVFMQSQDGHTEWRGV